MQGNSTNTNRFPIPGGSRSDGMQETALDLDDTIINSLCVIFLSVFMESGSDLNV